MEGPQPFDAVARVLAKRDADLGDNDGEQQLGPERPSLAVTFGGVGKYPVTLPSFAAIGPICTG